MATTEIVAGELVPAERMVLDYADRSEQIREAKAQATALAQIIDERKLSMKIGRSEHVFFEGWATLGAFNHISVHTVWTKPLEDGRGWEARAEARTVNGRVVGTAEAMCSRDERNWQRSDDYALRSMAQTRAGAKALKAPLSWVMTLAGKSPTPAEEMPVASPTEAEGPLYGPAASSREYEHLGKAVMHLRPELDIAEAIDLTDGLVAWCGGYLPKVAAIAVMVVAGYTSSKQPTAADDYQAEAEGEGIDYEAPEPDPPEA